LKDTDSYVRKTAAVCVAKLYSINPDLVAERGFLEDLRKLVRDENPMVVANSMAALVEIHGHGSSVIDTRYLTEILSALDICTEWGQISILECLINYDSPNAGSDAIQIIQNVAPKLQHANHAVVLACIRVILSKVKYAEEMRDELLTKIIPSLVTLLSAEAEIQYVALSYVCSILKQFNVPFTGSYKSFFCKYNDPSYVKYQKLEVLVMLVTEENISDIILELKEYSGEVDIEFARKAIRAIGACALKVRSHASQCVNALLHVVETKVNYAVQEAMIVMKDMFRCFPGEYESIIGSLCLSLTSLDEPDAKQSLIWILGEYAERIDNVLDIVRSFFDGLVDEPVTVQLQLLTTAVKLFLKCPSDDSKMIVQNILSFATNESEHPDLRDRAYVYWRLLSHSSGSAAQVVSSQVPIPRPTTS